jgi:mono/diheme cytochrome c family protein
MKKFAIRVIFAGMILLAGYLAIALLRGEGTGPWRVPEEAQQRRNPVADSEATRSAGRILYMEHCAKCHGTTGRGDGPESAQYSTKPPDFTERDRMTLLTDGELFYKISEGRRPMPPFRKTLSEQQRWQLVHFLRTFAAEGEGR